MNELEVNFDFESIKRNGDFENIKVEIDGYQLTKKNDTLEETIEECENLC